MIFYFSATGNSKHVARLIGEKTGERIISITDCLKKGEFEFSAADGEIIGIVTPTYSWGLPSTVIEFIDRLSLKHGDNYVFTVATYGTLTGGVSDMLKSKLREKSIKVTAQFSVRMPDTWTPVYDLSDKNKVAGINARADKKIAVIAKQIQQRKKGNRDCGRMPFYKCFYKDYDSMRRTSSLSVNENCNGCGVCAEICPVGAIEMQNGNPVRVKEKCALCLGCLHHCPQFAVERGEKTKLHGQYVHKDWND